MLLNKAEANKTPKSKEQTSLDFSSYRPLSSIISESAPQALQSIWYYIDLILNNLELLQEVSKMENSQINDKME